MMSEARIIGEHYRLLGLLGEGGMSIVYAGEDITTNTPVAIKLLKPEIIDSNPNIVERFVREGEVLRRLNHPNIVKMLAAFEHDGQHYVVMERVSGGDMAQLLRERGPLSIERVLDIALDLTDALIRAHRLNVIHRDIKPANVLLAEDGTPRLTDFGVARLGDATSVTKSGTLVGTIAYLSPEGCLGEPLDARADIWSFGVMLYEMLTGYRPFMDVNTAALLTAILTRPVPPLDKLRPNCPPALVQLIYRMLEKDRDNRISSARQVGAWLEAIIAGRSPEEIADLAERDLPPSTPPPPTAPPEDFVFDDPDTVPPAAAPSFAEVQQAVEGFRSTRGTPPPSQLPDTHLAADSPVIQQKVRTVSLTPLLLGAVLLVLAIIAAVVILPRLGESSGGVQTVAPVQPSEYMALVAQLEGINGATDTVSRFIVDDLRRKFEQEARFTSIRIRAYPGVITSAEQAAQAAEANDAPLVMWGNYDGSTAELNFQLGSLATLPPHPFPRSNLEDMMNVMVRLTDPRQQSLASSVVASFNSITGANADAFNLGANLAALELLNPTPAEIVGSSPAAGFHRLLAFWVSDIDAGLTAIDAAIRLDSRNPILFSARALGKLRAGRIAEAAIDIGTAGQLAPESWSGADIVYGQSALLIANNPAGAIPFFDSALAKNPDDWLSLTFRGAAHYMTGNYAQADVDISRALSLEPRFNAPYSFAALNAFREGRLLETLALIRTVQERFPDSAIGERLTSGVYNVPKDRSPLVGLIAAYGNFTLFQWDEVIRNAELVSAQTDRLPGVLVLQGIAECNLGRYTDAEASYTRALQADREFPAVYLLRADVRRKQGNLQGMAADAAVVATSPQAAIYAQLAPALVAGDITCENLFEINLADYGLTQ